MKFPAFLKQIVFWVRTKKESYSCLASKTIHALPRYRPSHSTPWSKDRNGRYLCLICTIHSSQIEMSAFFLVLPKQGEIESHITTNSERLGGGPAVDRTYVEWGLAVTRPELCIAHSLNCYRTLSWYPETRVFPLSSLPVCCGLSSTSQDTDSQGSTRSPPHDRIESVQNKMEWVWIEPFRPFASNAKSLEENVR